MSDRYDEAQRRRSIAPIIALALLLWCANFYFAIYFPWGDGENDSRGTFGDVFGVVNSIFSGLAFIGVAWSISMQRDELRITREDRDDTRRILDAQQANLETQNESNRIARFETTFFQLFQSFRELITGLKVGEIRGTVRTSYDYQTILTTSATSGQSVFKNYLIHFKILHQQLNPEFRWDKPIPPDKKFVFVNSLALASIELFDEHGDDIGRYYRTLYTLLRFVDTAQISPDDKYFYTKLIRAQLSQDESILLLTNMNSNYTTLKFNSLIERYGMCKNVDEEDYIVAGLRGVISDSVFGRTFGKW